MVYGYGCLKTFSIWRSDEAFEINLNSFEPNWNCGRRDAHPFQNCADHGRRGIELRQVLHGNYRELSPVCVLHILLPDRSPASPASPPTSSSGAASGWESSWSAFVGGVTDNRETWSANQTLPCGCSIRWWALFPLSVGPALYSHSARIWYD